MKGVKEPKARTTRGRAKSRTAQARVTRPPAPWPDLKPRRRAVLGDRIVAPSGSDVVIDGRGDH